MSMVASPVLQAGFKEVGKPYAGPIVGQSEDARWGSVGWDCSSFVSGAYKAAGIQLPAFTDAIADATQIVKPGEERPGDIVLYKYADPAQPGVKYPHTGLWLGGGKTLDSSFGQGVGVHDVLDKPYEIRRPDGAPNAAPQGTGQGLPSLNGSWLGSTFNVDQTADYKPSAIIGADARYAADQSGDPDKQLDTLRQATWDDIMRSAGLGGKSADDQAWDRLNQQNQQSWEQVNQFSTTMQREIDNLFKGDPAQAGALDGYTLAHQGGQAMVAHAANSMKGMEGNPWAVKAAQVGYQTFLDAGLPQPVAQKLAPIFTRQMYQESGFDPAVISGQRTSPAGAVGIAQIMPQFHPGVNPLDPEAALKYAAGLFATSYQAYGGNVAKTLAAYNAGAGTVNKAVDAGGADWMTKLPDETKGYLTSILGLSGI